tara:strand:+ start:80 stop:346 length:267 start_codon:yes stop_codon:yes gene_type:complete
MVYEQRRNRKTVNPCNLHEQQLWPRRLRDLVVISISVQCLFKVWDTDATAFFPFWYVVEPPDQIAFKFRVLGEFKAVVCKKECTQRTH